MNIKMLVLQNDTVLISQIEETGADVGEPNCKLTAPFTMKKHPIEGLDSIMEPWLSEYSRQNVFMISSDKILTLFEPKPTLLEKYQDLIK